MVNVSFPSVSACTRSSPGLLTPGADEWHAEHSALTGVPSGRVKSPKYNFLPRSSDGVNVYRFCGGVPNLEASNIELNWLISAEASYAAIASVMIAKSCGGVYFLKTSRPYTLLNSGV